MKFGALGRLFAVLALAFLLTGTLAARPFLVLFGSESCDDCNALKDAWKEEMTEAGSPVLVYVCIDDDDAYSFLKKSESLLKAGAHPAVFPVLLAGRKFYYGIDAIKENFEDCLKLAENAPAELSFTEFDAIRECAEMTTENYVVCKTVLAENAGESTEGGNGARLQNGDAKTSAFLFLETAAASKHSERQNREVELLKKDCPSLEIDRYEITDNEGQLMYLRFLRHFDIEENGENLAPLVAWNDGYVSGRLATSEELAAALEAAQNAAEAREPFWRGDATADELAELSAHNKTFLLNATFWTALFAGTLDGINPCAFATAIFLISYLLYLKKGRHFVLAVGLCFCLGVFLSYLLFGIGLSFLVDFLNKFAFVKKIIYGLFALAGLILAIMHLRDALRYRKSGNASDMDMGLNVQTHRKIHDKIHTWGKLTGAIAIPAAVVLGCVVSSMEFVCTGQIYLPMLVAINASGFNLYAFLLLLVYNLAFIIPLVAVTFLAYYGVGAQALAKWARNHVLVTKIFMAALFLALAGLMVWMMWWSL
ncbi:MAG: hypothetical protein MJ106_05670 [Lentisphaeria bacterium]|nr:hypothetical protein [Lentisphaeria bacterium]